MGVNIMMRLRSFSIILAIVIIISGITLVGALISAGIKATPLTTILGFIAVAFATINVVGGFLVTHRMLGMFRKKE